jgi:hypothetical protein
MELWEGPLDHYRSAVVTARGSSAADKRGDREDLAGGTKIKSGTYPMTTIPHEKRTTKANSASLSFTDSDVTFWQ